MVKFGVDFVNVESTRAEKDWSFWNSISVIESWHKTSEKKRITKNTVPQVYLLRICLSHNCKYKYNQTFIALLRLTPLPFKTLYNEIMF